MLAVLESELSFVMLHSGNPCLLGCPIEYKKKLKSRYYSHINTQLIIKYEVNLANTIIRNEIFCAKPLNNHCYSCLLILKSGMVGSSKVF